MYGVFNDTVRNSDYGFDSWDDLKSHSGCHLVGCDGMNDILFQKGVPGDGGGRFLQNMSNISLESVLSPPRILSLHIVNNKFKRICKDAVIA